MIVIRRLPRLFHSSNSRMAAAARAEARKKAILARGTDRLAKLTTSARGDDGSVFGMHSSSVLHSRSLSQRNFLDPRPHVSAPSTQNFLGEDSSVMPIPHLTGASRPTQTTSRATNTATSIGSSSSVIGDSSLFDALSGSSTTASSPNNPSAWLPEHQQQFMQALLHASSGAAAGGSASLPGLSSPIGDPTSLVDPSAPPIDNPFAALLGLPGAGGSGIGAFPPGMKFPAMQPPPIQEQKPKTILQKVLPLLHLAAVWCLLAYFVLSAEPKAYAQANAHVLGVGEDGPLKWDPAFLWKRWMELGKRQTLRNSLESFRVQVVVWILFLLRLQFIDVLANSLFFGHLPHSNLSCTQCVSLLVS